MKIDESSTSLPVRVRLFSPGAALAGILSAFALTSPFPASAQDTALSQLVPAGMDRASEPQVPVPAGPEGTRYEPVPLNLNFDPAQVASHESVLITITGMDREALFHFAHRDAESEKELAPILDALSRLPPEEETRSNHTYVEDSFAPVLPNAYIVPFPWTRNPLQSKSAMNDFRKWLELVCDAAVKAGKPVDIAAHSWGGLLSYTLLKKLQDEGSSLRINRYISIEAPFHPREWWVIALTKLGVKQQGLASSIAPLSNVNDWTNVYANRDTISNKADSGPARNVRIDEKADALEAELREHFSGQDGKQARKDLDALNDSGKWHQAPFGGIHVELKSLNRRVDMDIMRDYIAPLF